MDLATVEITFDFQHVPVTSSNILSAAWDSQVLEVRFRSGPVYRYFNVPEQVYLDLINPAIKISKGTYLKKSVEGKPYVRKDA